MLCLIDTIKAGLPEGLAELQTLGRTMDKRRDDITAYFDHLRHQRRTL